MKPHPRIRKTIKWGGLALTVLLVVMWIGSGWWIVSWSTRRGYIFIVCDGLVDVVRMPKALARIIHSDDDGLADWDRADDVGLAPARRIGRASLPIRSDFPRSRWRIASSDETGTESALGGANVLAYDLSFAGRLGWNFGSRQISPDESRRLQGSHHLERPLARTCSILDEFAPMATHRTTGGSGGYFSRPQFSFKLFGQLLRISNG